MPISAICANVEPGWMRLVAGSIADPLDFMWVRSSIFSFRPGRARASDLTAYFDAIVTQPERAGKGGTQPQHLIEPMQAFAR